MDLGGEFEVLYCRGDVMIYIFFSSGAAKNKLQLEVFVTGCYVGGGQLKDSCHRSRGSTSRVQI